MPAAAGSELIALRGAAFGYRGRAVVSDVDLVVEPGTMLGVMGPNGAGKTTLLRGVLGLLPPLAGDVRVASGALGYVPQRDRLDSVFPLTVEEVVRMGAYGRVPRARRLPAAERAFVAECLGRVRLGEHRGRLFAELSGGQRQRALIARALVMRPRVLLLDEPTTGVDGTTLELVLELLARLNREEDLAVLVVTHEPALTRRVVRETLWVADGRVRRGATEAILREHGHGHGLAAAGEGS